MPSGNVASLLGDTQQYLHNPKIRVPAVQTYKTLDTTEKELDTLVNPKMVQIDTF